MTPPLDGVDATYSPRGGHSGREGRALRPGFARLLRRSTPSSAPPADSDSANTRELRAQLFGVLGYYGKDPAVLAQARQIADKYLADPGSVDATLGEAALAIAARNGDAQLFDRLQKIYETSTNPEFQDGALRLLAEFEDPALAQRSLDYAVSGKVRNQDAAIQFAIALQTDATRDQAWKYIQTHWETFRPCYPGDGRRSGRAPPAVSAPPRIATASSSSSQRTKSLPPIRRSSTPSKASTAASSCARSRSQT